MSILSLQDIQVAFGSQDVLLGINGVVEAGDRIGLVGRNGSGKTTLLRVLTGELRPSQGKRHIAKGVSLGLVEQIPSLPNSDHTVYDEAMSAFSEIVALEQAVEEAAHRLSDGGDEAAAHYTRLAEQLEDEGGYAYQGRLAQVLSGLGFAPADWQQPVRELSGGTRTRLALAKALLAQPKLLVLDEPTNHIDLDAMRWLDDFLSRWPGSLVVTSHDRYFLDRVANRVWSLENGRIKSYRGNYSQFETLRAAEIDLQTRQATAQQEVIAKEEEFIRRYRAGQRAREAKGRQKRLDRVERLVAPTQQRSANFRLSAQRGGDLVLATRDLVVGYSDTPLMRVGTLEVVRGQHIALIGPNGSGKTTLLKTLTREIAAVSGSSSLGSGIKIAHYWQEAENLDPSKTVFEELCRDRTIDAQAARNLLGSFLFSGDDVYKLVSVLSGGERSRLALAKLMLENANLLVLDEPTNHLDIPARKSLETALASYEGTIVFVSHDRRLISDLATAIWSVEDDRLTTFDGTFEEYLQRAATTPAAPEKRAVLAKPVASSKAVRQMRERVQTLERDIEAREAELEQTGDLINEASSRSDLKLLAELGARFEELKVELSRLYDEWAVTQAEPATTTSTR